MEFILFTMLALIVIVALLASRLTTNNYPYPFERKTAIYTPAEKNFQNLLELAVGNQYRVLNRVKLSDVVTVRKGIPLKAAQQALTQAKTKTLDFAICKKESMELVGTIDLVDDKGKGYKLKNDWFVKGTLDAAGIPHVRVKIKPSYSLDEVKACVYAKFAHEFTSEPRYRGRVIPAPLVKARPKPKYTGVVSPTAAKAAVEQKPAKAKTLIKPELAALPH
jgi:hypothetical protein